MTREQLENAVKAIEALRELVDELDMGHHLENNRFKYELTNLSNIIAEARDKCVTICVECRHILLDLEQHEFSSCNALGPTRRCFVTGTMHFPECRSKNFRGECPHFQRGEE